MLRTEPRDFSTSSHSIIQQCVNRRQKMSKRMCEKMLPVRWNFPNSRIIIINIRLSFSLKLSWIFQAQSLYNTQSEAEKILRVMNSISGTNPSQNPNQDGTEKQLDQNPEITTLKSETGGISQSNMVTPTPMLLPWCPANQIRDRLASSIQSPKIMLVPIKFYLVIVIHYLLDQRKQSRTR